MELSQAFPAGPAPGSSAAASPPLGERPAEGGAGPDPDESAPRTVCASSACDYQGSVVAADPGRYCPWCGQDLVTLSPSSSDPSAPGPEAGGRR